ncbi:MAG TPA: hypothetical protein VK530_01840, partial [Candidatus Acidoferrum sp.]|nr:hypothetical protein [Candidatus Acidoferrum sp.]
MARELDKAAHTLAAEFPTAPDPWSLMFEAVQLYAQARDFKQATALSDELAKSTNAPAELRARGERTATRYGFLGKPFDL